MTKESLMSNSQCSASGASGIWYLEFGFAQSWLVLAIPVLAVPSHDAFQEFTEIATEQSQQSFSFFRRGQMGFANVAGNGAVFSDPAPGCRLKWIAERHRLGRLEIANQL